MKHCDGNGERSNSWMQLRDISISNHMKRSKITAYVANDIQMTVQKIYCHIFNEQSDVISVSPLIQIYKQAVSEE